MGKNIKKIIIVTDDKKITNALKSILKFRYNLLMFQDLETALNYIPKDKNIRLVIIHEDFQEGELPQVCNDANITILKLKDRMQKDGISEEPENTASQNIIFFPFEKEKTLNKIKSFLA